MKYIFNIKVYFKISYSKSFGTFFFSFSLFDINSINSIAFIRSFQFINSKGIVIDKNNLILRDKTRYRNISISISTWRYRSANP